MVTSQNNQFLFEKYIRTFNSTCIWRSRITPENQHFIFKISVNNSITNCLGLFVSLSSYVIHDDYRQTLDLRESKGDNNLPSQRNGAVSDNWIWKLTLIAFISSFRFSVRILRMVNLLKENSSALSPRTAIVANNNHRIFHTFNWLLLLTLKWYNFSSNLFY